MLPPRFTVPLLAAALLLTMPSDTEGASTRCSFAPGCSLSITFTGTVVPTVALEVSARDGVLVATWSCTGLEVCERPGEERTAIALYDADVMGVRLTLDPFGPRPLLAHAVGGRLAWVGPGGRLVAEARP